MANENAPNNKIEEINGVLNEIHGDIAYVTLFDMEGNSEDVCLDSDIFISHNAWLPKTKFQFEYYETKSQQGISLRQEFRILEHGKESYTPSLPIQSLRESLDKIEEYMKNNAY